MSRNSQRGFIGRIWRGLRSPSARYSVLTLLVVGVIVGFVATAGTQVMVNVTGTDKFCGTACHSMQWVAKEHKESVHVANRTGVKAGCHDCHIPHNYPELLWYKAKAGTKDVIGEMRGVIDTKAKFEAKRKEMAEHVYAEYKGNDSRACRHCHQFSKEVIAKQKEMVQPIHTMVLQGQGTCIDCHQGVAHTPPS
jgi:nitrate/TMAO reductase-like tetraheme cytochrome c subunit